MRSLRHIDAVHAIRQLAQRESQPVDARVVVDRVVVHLVRVLRVRQLDFFIRVLPLARAPGMGRQKSVSKLR